MGRYFGQVFWAGILGRYLGNVFWAGILRRYFGKVFWEGILGRYFGKVFWAGILGRYFAQVFWEGILGRFFGKVSVTTAVGILLSTVWGLALESLWINLGSILASFGSLRWVRGGAHDMLTNLIDLGTSLGSIFH